MLVFLPLQQALYLIPTKNPEFAVTYKMLWSRSQSSIEDRSVDKSVTTTFGVNRPTISCFFDRKDKDYIVEKVLRSQWYRSFPLWTKGFQVLLSEYQKLGISLKTDSNMIVYRSFLCLLILNLKHLWMLYLFYFCLCINLYCFKFKIKINKSPLKFSMYFFKQNSKFRG